MKRISIDKIKVDSRVQPRSGLIQQAIDDYAIAMRDGAKFPPIVVFENGEGSYLLAHGFHRYRAALKAGLAEISAEVEKGDLHDAKLFAAGANRAQDKIGMRWTNKDKRHAVEMLLGDEKWRDKSDRWIAQVVGVGHELVRSMRPQLASDASSKRVGLDGKSRPAHKPRKVKGEKNEGLHVHGNDAKTSSGDEARKSEGRGDPEEGDRTSFDSEGAGKSSDGDSTTSKMDRSGENIDWGEKAKEIKKKISKLVKEFDGYEDKLDSLLAEIRDFHEFSRLEKEAKEIDAEIIAIVKVGDRIRSKFMS